MLDSKLKEFNDYTQEALTPLKGTKVPELERTKMLTKKMVDYMYGHMDKEEYTLSEIAEICEIKHDEAFKFALYLCNSVCNLFKVVYRYQTENGLIEIDKKTFKEKLKTDKKNLNFIYRLKSST